MSCGQCDQCRSGRENTCRVLRFLGCPGQAEGSLSEYLVMPQQNCFPIADRLSLAEATLSEPLAIGVYAAAASWLDQRGTNRHPGIRSDRTLGVAAGAAGGLRRLLLAPI